MTNLLTGRETVEELLKTSLPPNSSATYLRPDLHLEANMFEYPYLAIAETKEITYYLVREKDFVFFGLSNYRVVPVKKVSNLINIPTALTLSSILGVAALSLFLGMTQIDKGYIPDKTLKGSASAMLVLLVPLSICPLWLTLKK